MIQEIDFSDISVNAEDLKARAARIFNSSELPEKLMSELRAWEKRWKAANSGEYIRIGLLSSPESSPSYCFGGSFDCLLSLVSFPRVRPIGSVTTVEPSTRRYLA